MSLVTRTVAKTYFNTGDTPTEAQFVNFLDSIKWYNEYGELWAEDHGVATGNTGSANTTAMNTFLALCETEGKRARIGGGTFSFAGVLTKAPHVDLVGAGSNRTIFKSTTANTLLATSAGHTGVSDVPQVQRQGLISGITLDGDGVGTIGLHLYRQTEFILNDVLFYDFDTYGIHIEASILGTFRDCRWWGMPVGVKADEGSSFMAPNMVSFYNCKFIECTSWCVDAFGAGMMLLDHSTLERCGTNGDASTGIIKFGGNWDQGLIMRNCWLEANGGWMIDLVGGAASNEGERAKHIFDGVQVKYDGFGRTATGGIRAVTSDYMDIIIENSKIDITGTDVATDGANIDVYVSNSTIGSHSEANGSTYTVGGSGDVTTTGTQTLTNKRITPRVQAVTSSATVTGSWDNDDAVKITAQAAGLTLANFTGTPTAMQAMVIRIKDNGTARSITYGSQFRAIGVTLPTTTVISKTIYLGCIWNSDDSKIDVIGYSIEA